MARENTSRAVVDRTSGVGKAVRLFRRPMAPEFAWPRNMEHLNSSAEGLNLGTHRAPASVWERRGWDGSRERLAVTRLLVGIGGGALAIQGIRQRTWTGRMLAGLGGTLAWWALTGEGDLSDAHHWFNEVLERAPWWRTEDLVHQASAESF